MQKGGTQWETRAAKKIRKRVRNRTPKNRNKNQKTTLISSQKESLDRNHSLHPYGADTDVGVREVNREVNRDVGSKTTY
jgi:hypothetical protein